MESVIGGSGKSFSYHCTLIPGFGCQAGLVLALLKENLLFRILILDELGLCCFLKSEADQHVLSDYFYYYFTGVQSLKE